MTLTELIDASKNGPVYIRQKHPRRVDGGLWRESYSTTYLLVNSLSKVPCGYNYGVLLQNFALGVRMSVEYIESYEPWTGKQFSPTCVIEFDCDRFQHITEEWLNLWEFVENNRLPDNIASLVEDKLYTEMDNAQTRWIAWQGIQEKIDERL